MVWTQGEYDGYAETERRRIIAGVVIVVLGLAVVAALALGAGSERSVSVSKPAVRAAENEPPRDIRKARRLSKPKPKWYEEPEAEDKPTETAPSEAVRDPIAGGPEPAKKKERAPAKQAEGSDDLVSAMKKAMGKGK